MSLWNWGRIPLNIFYFFCPISACCSCQWIHAKGLHKRYRNLQTPPPQSSWNNLCKQRAFFYSNHASCCKVLSLERERPLCRCLLYITHLYRWLFLRETLKAKHTTRSAHRYTSRLLLVNGVSYWCLATAQTESGQRQVNYCCTGRWVLCSYPGQRKHREASPVSGSPVCRTRASH